MHATSRTILLAALVLVLFGCRRAPPDAPADRAQPPPARPPSPAPPPASQPAAAAAAPTPATDVPASLPALAHEKPPSRAERRAAAASINAFGAGAFRELRGQAGNLAFSPASAAVALGMASAGARGKTLSEMRGALSHSLAPARQHLAFGALERRWQRLRGQGLRVRSANRIFGSTRVPFAPGFVDWLAKAYRAPLEQLDFSAPDAAAARVNAWIASRTARRIREAVGPEAFGRQNALVLANALYFRARWKDEFDREATRRRPFWAKGVDRVLVPMMHREDYHAFARRKSTLVVELPYLGRFSMFVLLPRSRTGIAQTGEECLQPRLTTCLRRLSSTYIDLQLPRFRIETGRLSLRPALERLGVGAAFNPQRADFTAIAPARWQLFIERVAQKVFVAVDEKGTEAAAATVAGYGIGDIPPKPVPFHVDRPFIFLIRDRANGAVLFVGRVVDPRES